MFYCGQGHIPGLVGVMQSLRGNGAQQGNCAMPSHPDCPRQVVFTLPGAPGVQITATEINGEIHFTIDVLDTFGSTGDLRALFFNIADEELAGLTVTSGDSLLTESRVGNNNILDLGDGANLAGKVKTGFDVGLEWGTPGGKYDDINFPVEFTLSNSTGDLTLDDLGGMLFGAKLDSVGGPGGPRGSSSKLTTIAPFAPDANDDFKAIYEDNAADADSPSKSPTAVLIDVLDNDTDADAAPGTLVIEHLIDGFGPSHGTVEIIDNQIYYTPELDYSGSDTFWYCMSDGQGGQDSAMVTVNISAVADDPIIGIEVAQGATINEILLTVTATENDADHSEDITSLVAGGVPDGVTIVAVGPATGTGDSMVQQFLLTTAAGQDWDFNVDFTATSTESSNGDTESSTAAQRIFINYEHHAETLTYSVDDQSIWGTGDAFHYDLSGDEGFYGIKIPETHDGVELEDPVFGTDIASVSWGYGFTAGLQLDVHIDGGGIDASVPVDVTVDSTYNHTTDAIYIDSSVALGSGGWFDTTGPEGHLKIDALLSYLIEAHIGGWSVPDADFGPYSNNYDYNFVDLNTGDPAYTLPLLPGLDLIAEWPHISVENDPGTLSGSAYSNNMLALNLDIDQLVFQVLLGGANPLDSDPTTEDNFEIADLDLVGGLRLLQEFAVGLGSGDTVNLVLEDDTVIPLTIGTGLWIENASSHDADQNGTVTFGFALDPDVELTNSTSIDINLSAQAALLRNIPVIDYTVWSDDDIPIANVPIEVYNDTFALNGVGSQNVEFWV